MNKKITKALKKMGIPQHINGWDYIGYAIELVIKDKEMIHNITKRLYPAIAEKFNTTSSRVERGIRNAIETSINTVSPDVIEEVFGNNIPAHKDKPCNSHYIAAVVQMIKEEE